MSSIQIAATLWLVFPVLLTAQEASPLPDGNAYVRSAISGTRVQDAAINDFSYDLEETRERLDGSGKVKSRHVRRYEVYFVETRPVKRLVTLDGAPLGRKEQAAEDLKAQTRAKAIVEGRTLSEQPGVRIRLSSLAESVDFKTVGREARNGRNTLVFDFEPKTGSGAGNTREAWAFDAVAKILTGQLRIDETDRRVVQLEAHNSSGQKASVSTGVKLGTIVLAMEFSPVSDGVWLPLKVVSVVSGRAFLFKTFRIRQTTIYSNYRRFRVDTEERPLR